MVNDPELDLSRSLCVVAQLLFVFATIFFFFFFQNTPLKYFIAIGFRKFQQRLRSVRENFNWLFSFVLITDNYWKVYGRDVSSAYRHIMTVFSELYYEYRYFFMVKIG